VRHLRVNDLPAHLFVLEIDIDGKTQPGLDDKRVQPCLRASVPQFVAAVGLPGILRIEFGYALLGSREQRGTVGCPLERSKPLSKDWTAPSVSSSRPTVATVR